TSDPFELDPTQEGQPLVVVRNYTSIPFDDQREGNVDDFTLRAFTCQNDTDETRYDYYYYPFGYAYELPSNTDGGKGVGFSGAASGVTEFCNAATLGEYEFI